MSSLQPLTNRKLQIRLAIGLFAIAGLYFGWTLFSNFMVDPDTGTVNSVGWIAAVEETENGSQAVVIKPDGTIMKAPGYNGTASDQMITWQPDGNRLYFSSNRDTNQSSFHIYRWNPAHDVVQRRSIGSRSQDRPAFPVDNTTTGTQDLLVISGGLVLALNPRTGTSRQMLPFVGKNPTTVADDQGGGMSSQFGPEYDHLGNSFRQATWSDAKQYIVGVLEKDSGGESMVVQDMNPKQPADMVPKLLGSGEHIDYAVSPKDGTAVAAIQSWQWPEGQPVPKEFIKNNHVTTPYFSLLAMYSPATKKYYMITASKDSKVAFAQPQVSPDGSKIAFVAGPFVNGGVDAKALFVCPLEPNAGSAAVPIFQGPAYDPHWSPDGSKLTFIREVPGTDNDVCVINSDGSDFQDLTNGKGNFTSPSFSPQIEKAPSGS